MPNDVINTITIGGTTYDIGGSGGGSGRAINATLLANGWDTNKRQALQFIGYNVNQNGVIGMPTSVTSTQKTAYQNADIRIYSQSSDTFTFECGATVPTIDLPVTLFVTDASSTAAFVYKPAGSKTVAELISSLLVEANLGNVYNMTDSGTTTADFVEGAGKPIYAGDDVGIIDNGTSGSPSYKFNKLGGFIDLSNYIQKSLTTGLVKNDGSIDETEYQPTEEGKGLSTNDFTNDDKALIGNIKGNNTVLTTDKTPFFTRQTLNPTGFSGYVREKLIGASYAWNQLVENGNFASTDGWSTYQATISVSNNVCTMVRAVASGSNSMYRVVTKQPNHKYLWSLKVKNNVGSNSIMVQWFKSGTSGSTMSLLANTGISNSYTTYSGIIATDNSDVNGALIIFLTTTTVNNSIDIKEIQVIDLTLAFGSTIADYLYSLANNGGITKLRDMGCPIDKYTPYGYGLYSVKTSGKKIVGKNLVDIDTCNVTGAGWAFYKTEEYYFPVSTYAFSFDLSGSSSQQVQVQISKGTEIVGSKVFNISNGHCSTSFETSAIGDGIRFYVNGAGIFSNIQLELGSTSTTYEPYCGYEISLGNDELRGKFDLVNGEIVASGDVKESNGEITRNWVEYTFTGNESGAVYGQGFYIATGISGVANDAISSKFVFTDNVNNVYNGTINGSCCVANSDGRIGFYKSDITTLDAMKAYLAGSKIIMLKVTPTTEQSTPFADPMSMVGATTEEYIDTRDIPCPVGAERQYMGESDDVIPIPSSPMSDGKRVLTSYKSGDEEWLVWEGSMIIKDVKSGTIASSGLFFIPKISGYKLFAVESSYGYCGGFAWDSSSNGWYLRLTSYNGTNITDQHATTVTSWHIKE